MEKLDTLLEWRDAQIAGELFMGLPDAWYDDVTWVCESGHISRRYLKSEALGSNVCLACHKPIVLSLQKQQKKN